MPCRLSLTFIIVCKTLKKEGRAFQNVGKEIYFPDCKISVASFVLFFHLLLIRSFIRIRYFFFVSWSFLSKLNMDFSGKVWKRVWKMTVFSLKHGKGLENQCRKHTPTWSSSQPSGAQNLERATSMHSCQGVFTDQFIFRTVLARILNIF